MQEEIQKKLAEEITKKYEFAFARKLSSAVKDKAKLPDMTASEIERYDEW